MPTNLIEQVLKTVRNFDMLKPDDTVLAAVSGGPDSVFLLHALMRLENKLKMKRIVVCNLDHGLRGRESAGDSLFVKKLAKELGIEFIHKKIDLKKRLPARLHTDLVVAGGPRPVPLAPSGLGYRARNDDIYRDMSVEEVAREERYKFFHDAAKRVGADCVATGHTLDDQAETVLMRIIKGSALKGIVGISPVREEGRLRIARPLLEIEKAEIVKYLDSSAISYRIDSSNLETKYFRNAVRRKVMPFLERYNPRIRRALFNLAEHLREDFEFIGQHKRKAAEIIKTKGSKCVEIDLKDLVMQPRALQKEILRDSLERSGGSVKKLSHRHWKEVEALIRHKRKGSSVDLPGGIRAARTERAIVFCAR
jgi:tRNA(Ile)-lysidine synthase